MEEISSLMISREAKMMATQAINNSITSHSRVLTCTMRAVKTGMEATQEQATIRQEVSIMCLRMPIHLCLRACSSHCRLGTMARLSKRGQVPHLIHFQVTK